MGPVIAIIAANWQIIGICWLCSLWAFLEMIERAVSLDCDDHGSAVNVVTPKTF